MRLGSASAWLAVLLLLAVPLAGCIGDDGAIEEQGLQDTAEDVTGFDVDAIVQNTTEGDQNATEAAVEQLDPLTFGGPHVVESFVLEGSFEAQEGAVGTGFFGLTDSAVHVHEITERIPQGQPVEVKANLTYDEGYPAYAYLFLQTEEGQIYSYDGRTVYNDHSSLEATVGRLGGEVFELVVVMVYPGHDQTFEYTLDVSLHSEPSLIVPSVPTAVTVEDASRNLTLAHLGPSMPVTVDAWGPDDAYLGRFTSDGLTSLQIPTGPAGPGEYVVNLLPLEEAMEGDGHHDHGLRAVPSVPAGEPAPQDGGLRLLGVELSIGERHAVQPGENVSWTFEASSKPLNVGIVGFLGQPGNLHPGFLTPGDGWEGALASPAGTAFELSTEVVWIGLLGEGWIYWLGDAANPNIVPGTYEGSFTLHDGTPIEVAEVVVTFAR